MKTVHLKLLKKFTLEDIKEMRDMKRKGLSNKTISRKFGCASTTAMWHTGDIPEYNEQIVY